MKSLAATFLNEISTLKGEHDWTDSERATCKSTYNHLKADAISFADFAAAQSELALRLLTVARTKVTMAGVVK